MPRERYDWMVFTVTDVPALNANEPPVRKLENVIGMVSSEKKARDLVASITRVGEWQKIDYREMFGYMGIGDDGKQYGIRRMPKIEPAT